LVSKLYHIIVSFLGKGFKSFIFGGWIWLDKVLKYFNSPEFLLSTVRPRTLGPMWMPTLVSSSNTMVSLNKITTLFSLVSLVPLVLPLSWSGIVLLVCLLKDPSHTLPNTSWSNTTSSSKKIHHQQ
jgi:hypothetical protein